MSALNPCPHCATETLTMPLSILIGFLRAHPAPQLLAAAYAAREWLNNYDAWMRLCGSCGCLRLATDDTPHSH